jgi:UDPglucose--hexose-1-phosphate uridylyltransferase
VSELRQNLLTGNWAVIAPERGEKPRAFESPASAGIATYPEYDPSCPFCPDNEERFPLEIIDTVKGIEENWVTRIINNKYKLFDDLPTCPIGPEPFKKSGLYSYYQGCGNHYLVIESRLHNRPMGAISHEEINNTLQSYLKICRLFKKNPNNLVTIVFKNQGLHAGASQIHAHSQIVGSRIVPALIRNAMHVQDKFFDDNGACALCTIVDHELHLKKRVVVETEHSVVLSPYAASAPYEIWIVPKRHFACYEDILDDELTDTAIALKRVLSAYITKLKNPDFNYFFHSAPHPLSNVPFYHLYIQILPRLTIAGGFEAGTRIPVNTVWPEAVPEFLFDDK